MGSAISFSPGEMPVRRLPLQLFFNLLPHVDHLDRSDMRAFCCQLATFKGLFVASSRCEDSCGDLSMLAFRGP